MTDVKLPRDRLDAGSSANIQWLPFRIRIASSDEDIHKAVAVRTQAYGLRVPGMETVLKDPEPDDYRDDAVLLIAESKEDGQVLGSLRLITNATHPLFLEQEVALPAAFKGCRLLEGWRLTVLNSEQARMVTAALCKSLFEISLRCDIDYVLAAARPPVDRIYRSMQFKDALAGEKLVLSNTLNIPHGLYYIPVREAATLWRIAKWPLYPFMALTKHPDIEIDHDVVRRRFHPVSLLNGGVASHNITV